VRLDHLLSKEHLWLGVLRFGWGMSGPWLMLQANVLWVGLLIGGALAIRFCWLVLGVSTARFGGFREASGVGWWGRAHCWVLRERAPGFCWCLLSSGVRGLACRVGGWGSGVRAGPASIPHQDLLVCGSGGLVVVVGWCPFVF
jgi:hypothetical protein